MKIADNIEFDESKNLSEQTPEFQQWYNEKVNPLINDTLHPDLLDEYKRPKSYTVTVDLFVITILPLYINPDAGDWRCRDFQLIIKTL